MYAKRVHQLGHKPSADFQHKGLPEIFNVLICLAYISIYVKLRPYGKLAIELLLENFPLESAYWTFEGR